MQTFKANGQRFNLNWVTGKVEEAGKNMETKIQGSGGGGLTYRGTGGTAPVSIKSHTVVHDQFFLTDANNNEHSFQLQDFNVACRSGNKLTVLWAIKEGNKSGPYISVYNHSTSTAYNKTKTMARLFRRPLWQLLVVAVILFILGSQSTFFYWMIPVAFLYWIIEGNMAARKFQKQLDFSQFS